ncbi:MAG: S1 RNA-binding domain-containing protein [Lachnospiraceae bacterium]|nr:S1 RNA-binding domain-containing protein [Lachnospiraceae bacterium]
MLELGKKQRLSIVKKVDFGVYLAEHMPSKTENAAEVETVLLPAKQVPEEFDVGDSLEVFLYKDSKDRLIATVNEPLVTLGRIASMEVAQVSGIGAFLSWGLERDLFLPFKEQTRPVKAGDRILAALYIDKSKRLAATMKLYPYLEIAEGYQKDDMVTGTVYEVAKGFGAYVAVDDKYQGMIPPKEPWNGVQPGDVVTARVTAVKEDGKLDLSLRQKAYIQMDVDGEKILARLREENGFLPLGDKSSPEEIRAAFDMSKNEYKRAIGRLYKQKKIEIGDREIRLIEK